MKRKSLIQTSGLTGAVLGNAASGVAFGAVGYLIARYFPLDENVQTFLVSGFVIVGIVLITFARYRVASISDEMGIKYMKGRTGIVETFSNLDECKDEMISEFEKASSVRMLLQIGRKELGDANSFFYDLAKTKSDARCHIRVLRASPTSPFFSKDRAKFRNTPVQQWHDEIQMMGSRLETLREAYHVSIEDRCHAEPFLWRIFIFDDTAFVSAYLFDRNNDRTANVYKIQQGDNSLYDLFDKTFEYFWRKYDSQYPDENTRWANWK